MTGNIEDAECVVAWLRTPEAVRERCHAVMRLGKRGDLAHFELHAEAVDPAADYVAEVIRENYPTLDIPYHSRWRHFCAGGIDRWAAIARSLGEADQDEIARIRFDLCVVSVLLDAGAGPSWRYHEQSSGQTFERSEGLAVASLHAFRSGLFSSDPRRPLQADAEGLARLDRRALGDAFQVDDDNSLLGLDGRLALMHRLGAVLASRPDLFAAAPARAGNLYDALKERADGALTARAILAAVLDGLSPIWPGRIELAGHNLGDIWRYPRLDAGGGSGTLVPFHKLSQWLTYSLAEVVEDSGVAVTGLNELTGLPEYRNGGLLLDLGVITLRDPELADIELQVEDEAVVEWRALTVALLDLLADCVRERFGRSADEMPLARILQGGTWEAGRRIARELRPGGVPPLRIASDGTVF